VYFGATFDARFDAQAARKLGRDSANGALITSVMPGSAASRTVKIESRKDGDKTVDVRTLDPLQINDIVLRFNGVDIQSAAQVAELVSASQAGQEVPIMV